MATDIDRSLFTEIEIPIPGGFVRGRWYGSQQIRPVLMLHGWQDNCGSFARLAPLLMSYGSFLCIDLPGHGRSTHLTPGIMYRSLEYVTTILRVMRSYGWKKVSLIGHSMGAYVSFYFTALYPDLVDVLIGIEMVRSYQFPPDIEVVYLKHLYQVNLKSNELLVSQNDGDKYEPPCYTFSEMEHLLYEASGESVLTENCKYILERNVTKSRKYPEKYYFSRDNRLKAIFDLNPVDPISEVMVERMCHLPHLLIYGGQTQNKAAQQQSFEFFEYVAKKNKLFKMHTIEHGTHHCHLNDPEETALHMLAFLRQHRPIEAVQKESTKGKL